MPSSNGILGMPSIASEGIHEMEVTEDSIRIETAYAKPFLRVFTAHPRGHDPLIGPLARARVPVRRNRGAVPVRCGRPAGFHDAREAVRRLPEPQELPLAPTPGERGPRRKRLREL